VLLGRDLRDRLDAQPGEIGQNLVVLRRVGAVGRPQRAVVVQGIELFLARCPVGVEQG
jgi:hypothetical protein